MKTEYRSTVGDMADNRKNTVAGTAHCDNVVQGSTGTATVTRNVQSTRHEVFTKIFGQNRSKNPHSTVRGNVSSVEMARDTMSDLQSERTELYNERRRTGSTEERKAEIGDRLKALSDSNKQLRRDLKLCADVLLRSAEIEEKRRILQEQAKLQKPTEKGKNKNARRRNYER